MRGMSIGIGIAGRALSLAAFILLPLCASSQEAGSRIDELRKISINGVEQMILIRSENANNPVLLYLHGGPGDSLIPFAYYATDRLPKTCTVVYWDQRGTGLSYRDGMRKESITLRQLMDDTEQVVAYLKKRFKQERIFLLGHSWGSVLGSLVVHEDPGSFHAYIGVGQVVSSRAMVDARIPWLESVVSGANARERYELQLVKQGLRTGYNLVRDHGGLVHNISMYAMQQMMAASPYRSDLYTNELYAKGELVSSGMAEEAASLDLAKSVKEIRVPAYYFLGRYDYVTPASPVLGYVEALDAPAKGCIWFEKSAHRMDIEEPGKFQDEIERIVKTSLGN
jgi:pimeloyl-ACP methyl ester carboxylesterase